MKIFILGAGKMGLWLAKELAAEYKVAVYDKYEVKLNGLKKVEYISNISEIKEFSPDMVINCVSLNRTIEAFESVIPYLPKSCVLSDITSVKTGLPEYYTEKGFPFVSTHPMFGPTFANINELKDQNAIIIKESDVNGKAFFRNFFKKLELNIYDYTFDEHDQTTAYSLSTPFASTIAFTACMKKLDAPGTTFKKHMKIAKGLLSEDDFLISEILFNPYTTDQLKKITDQLSYLTHIINNKDREEMVKFLNNLRKNIKDF